MTPMLFNLYTPQSPPPAEPLHLAQPLSVAAQILTRSEFDRLGALLVGDSIITFNGYIWKRIA